MAVAHPLMHQVCREVPVAGEAAFPGAAVRERRDKVTLEVLVITLLIRVVLVAVLVPQVAMEAAAPTRLKEVTDLLGLTVLLMQAVAVAVHFMLAFVLVVLVVEDGVAVGFAALVPEPQTQVVVEEVGAFNAVYQAAQAARGSSLFAILVLSVAPEGQ